MKSSKSAVQLRHVIFGYDPGSGSLALVDHKLVEQRKPLRDDAIIVSGITVTEEFTFEGSRRVINNKQRRFWLMSFPQRVRSRRIGSGNFVWAEEKGTIERLYLDTDGKQLFREARNEARRLVDERLQLASEEV